MEHCRLQIGCLLIVVYIGFIYIRECKRYHIKLSSNIFYKILILSTFSIIFDGTTAVTVNYLDHVNPILNKALHLIFLIGIDTVIYMMSGYMLRMTEVIPVNRRGSIFLHLPYIINVLIVVIHIGGLEFREGKYTNYSMGPKVYSLYACAILYNVFLLYYGIRYTKYLQKEKRTALLVSIPFFLITTIVSIIFPESLCVIIYVILSAVGLLMSSENTEKYIDKQTGMFNQYALGIVIREFMENKTDRVAAIISLSESDIHNTTTDWRSYITTLEKLQQFCLKEYNRQPYRIGDNGFVLLANSKESAEDYAAKIIDYTHQICNNNLHIEYSTISLSDYTDSDEYMFKMIDICIESINKSANYDFLTGTRNRNSFEKFLSQLRNDKIDVYYFISDVNNLKETNDILGHAAGDELIQTVAKLLCDTVGDNGWVFRQGGDEFAVLWKGNDAEDFLKLLYHKTKVMNKSRNIPVSFATGYGKILDSTGMEDADKMMYENKAKMKANKKKR